jgi:hypothetical protein
MRRPLGGLVLGAVAILLLTVSGTRADDPPLSRAQIALFESAHLKNIAKPVVLEYAFHRHGGPAGDFDDTVSAEIRTIHQDGKKDVWIDFLTGEHHLAFPPALGFSGNPLLMFFLEHDVVALHEATGAATQYFRTRVRQAFVDRAEMRPIAITLDGQKRAGTEIVLMPFHGDGNLARFPALAERTYRFILSDAVPGGLYQISTSVTASGDAPGLFEESMTYRDERDAAR